jgi:AAA+ superfamily predicted ATPase
MLHTRHITFLTLCFFNVSLSMQSSFAPMDHKPLKMKPLNMAEMPEEVRKELLQQIEEAKQAQPKKKTPTFSEEEIEEMEFIFESSPKKAQRIVNYLLTPEYLSNSSYRYVFFTGDPGTGKTETAKAIAHTMSLHGWDYKRISSTDLLGEYRNETAMRLAKEFISIESSSKPTIFIIDNLNLFLENTNSKYHDTNATLATLWAFLDRQKDNPNFFFIGTMYRVNKLSGDSKDRVFESCINFPLI